jgi:hypothetical protein
MLFSLFNLPFFWPASTIAQNTPVPARLIDIPMATFCHVPKVAFRTMLEAVQSAFPLLPSIDRIKFWDIFVASVPKNPSPDRVFCCLHDRQEFYRKITYAAERKRRSSAMHAKKARIDYISHVLTLANDEIRNLPKYISKPSPLGPAGKSQNLA